MYRRPSNLTPLIPASGTILFLVLALNPLVAQQSAQLATRTSVVYYGLFFVNEEGIREELTLSRDQQRELRIHRNEWLDQIWEAPVGSEERAAALRAVESALAAVLDEGQMKRLKQITLQQLQEKGYFGRFSLLHRIDDAADELKLTNAQKDKLADGVPFQEVLTGEQTDRWKTMTGEPFTAKLRPSFLGRSFLHVTIPLSLQYVTLQSIQEELKLTKEQVANVLALQRRWQEAFPARLGATEARPEFAEYARSIDESVAECFQPAQWKRLQQIQLRQSLGAGNEDSAVGLPEVVKQLKLTDDQLFRFKAIQEERRTAMVPFLLSGDGPDVIAQKIETRKKETYQQLRKVLSDAQQAKLKDLLGEPFKGEIYLGGAWGLSRTYYTPAYLTISGLKFVNAKPLHDELKLSQDQVMSLAALAKGTRTELGKIEGSTQSEKKRRELAQANEKALGDVLKPDQLARFKQITLQHSGRGFFPDAEQFPEVALGLQLTEEQKRKLGGGETRETVFTPEQMTKWRDLIGPPFTTDLLPPQPAGFVFPTPPLAVFCLKERSVQQELKLTPEQVNKLPDLERTWNDGLGDYRTLGGEEVTKRTTAAREKVERAITELLDKPQAVRLGQIELQQIHYRIGTVLTTDRVVKGLELNQDQQDRIKAIGVDAASVRGMILTELSLGSESLMQFNQAREGFDKLVEKQLTAVLTEGQQAKLKDLLGEPFRGQIHLTAWSLNFGPLFGGHFPPPDGGFGPPPF